MTDSHYLGAIQIWRNLNKYQYYLASTKSVIFQTDANCYQFHSMNRLPFSHQARKLKTYLVLFNIIFF